MHEESNNQIKEKKIAVISFISTILWFVLGYFYSVFFHFLTWVPLTILAAFFIHEKLPDKYLIPITFSLAIIYDFVESLIIKRTFSAWESFFWLMDFLIIIFIFFFLFSFRFIQKVPDKNLEKQEQEEVIIKKLLKLIFITIVTVIAFYTIQKYLYDYRN